MLFDTHRAPCRALCTLPQEPLQAHVVTPMAAPAANGVLKKDQAVEIL
jgi:hypothetical protein